jgi:hypothetical protein
LTSQYAPEGDSDILGQWAGQEMCKYSECPKRHKENELVTARLSRSGIAITLPGCIAAKGETFKVVPFRAASLILKGVKISLENWLPLGYEAACFAPKLWAIFRVDDSSR